MNRMAQDNSRPDVSSIRLKHVRSTMRELGFEALFTLEPTNIRWLTGWTEVFDDERAHLALITLNKALIHTDSRYVDVMLKKNRQGIWSITAERLSHIEFMRKILTRTRKKSIRLGVEASIRLGEYRVLKESLASSKVEVKDNPGIFSDARAVKDNEELKLLRKAQRLTDDAFANALTWIRPGMTEREIANRLEFFLREQGAEGIAFPSIVASGPNSALPHARPTSRRLRRGDFLTLDFGARYRDYAADMTRTLVIGSASKKQLVIYEAVLAAQTKAKAGIKAGLTGREAHDLALTELKQRGLSEAFTHSLGHGVGIDVHEKPVLSPQNDKPLVAGNVVTVEPGVYLPGYGGVRIEDFGVVREEGFTSFTRSSHDLIEIAVDEGDA